MKAITVCGETSGNAEDFVLHDLVFDDRCIEGDC